MPKVNITRSQTGIPSRTNFGGFGPIDITGNAGQALQQLGQSVAAFGMEKQRDYEIARDESYVSDTFIEGQRQLLELREAMREASFENPEDHTNRFVQESMKLRDSLIQNAPSNAARRELSNRLSSSISGAMQLESAFERSTIVDRAIAGRKSSFNTFTNNLRSSPIDVKTALGVYQGDFQDSRGGIISAPELKNVSETEKKEVIEAIINGYVDSGNYNAADKALQSSEAKALFTAEESERLDSFIEASVDLAANESKRENDKIVRETFQNQRQNIIEASSNKDLILATTEMERNVEAGVYDRGGNEHIQLQNQIKERQKQLVEINTARSTVQRALEVPGAVIDTENKTQVEYFNMYYTEEYRGQSILDVQDPEVRKSMMNTMYDAGAVPQKEQQRLSGAITSGTPAEAAAAADVIKNLTQNKNLAGSFSEDDIYFSSAYTSMTAGADFNRDAVVEILRENQGGVNDPNLRDILGQRVKSYMNSKEGQKDIADILKTNRGLRDAIDEADGEIPAQILSDLQVSASETYPRYNQVPTKTHVAARAESIARNYGSVSVFGNTSVFRTTLDLQDRPGTRKNYASKQIEEAIEEAIPELVIGMDDAQSIAMTDQIKSTAKIYPIREGGKDRFVVQYTNANGAIEQLMAMVEGQPVPLTLEVDANRELGVALNNMENSIDQMAKDLVNEGIEREQGLIQSFFSPGGTKITAESEEGKMLKEAQQIQRSVSRNFEILQSGMSVGGAPLLPKDRAEILRDMSEELQKLENLTGSDEISGESSSPDLGGGAGTDNLSEDVMSAYRTYGKEVYAKEGGNSRTTNIKLPHIPVDRSGTPIGTSGVTLGAGIDIGQMSMSQFNSLFDKAGVRPEVKDQYKPLVGLKGKKASTAMNSPESYLELSNEEEKALFGLMIDRSKASSDTLYKSSHAYKNNLEGKEALQAALISAYYQVGNSFDKEFPSFTKALKSGDYIKATEELIYANTSDKSKGLTPWVQQTPERVLPLIIAMERVSGENLKPIFFQENRINHGRIR